MSVDRWIDGSGRWTTASNWSDGVPTSSSGVVVSQGEPLITSPISISWLRVTAFLAFDLNGEASISDALRNDGVFGFYGWGGSNRNLSLTIGGDLINIGNMYLGALAAAQSDQITAKRLFNKGTLDLNGGSIPDAGSIVLDIARGPAGFGTVGKLTGDVELYNSAAIEFAFGKITSIASGASLAMSSAESYIEDANALGSDSALHDLQSVAGTLELFGGARLTINDTLTNTGTGAVAASVEIGLRRSPAV